jgi:hypothetical protein
MFRRFDQLNECNLSRRSPNSKRSSFLQAFTISNFILSNKMKVRAALSVLLASLATSHGKQQATRKQQAQRTQVSNNCQDGLKELEQRKELESSLQNSIQNFTSLLHSKPREYCADTGGDTGRVHLNCVVNFEDFSSEYVSICGSFGANYEPVSIFMECSSETKDLEMELVNMPTCLAQDCGQSEINTALNRALSMYATSSGSETLCQFYHRSIDIPLSASTTKMMKDVGKALDEVEPDSEDDSDPNDYSGSPNQ